MRTEAVKKPTSIAVILNGISFKKKHFYEHLLPVISSVAPTDVFETRTLHDATFQASKAVNKLYDLIIAAGGDGTLNQVLNGMMRANSKYALPVLGLLPLGSGNDFARTIGLSANTESLAVIFENYAPQKVDIGKVTLQKNSKEVVHYFINIVDAGMGPAVVKRINEGDQLLGASFAYFSSIIINFFTYKSIDISIKTDTWNWNGKIRTFAIANGKYFGNGLCVAPDAKPNDGMFNTFLCGDVSVLDFIRYSGTLKRGEIIDHPEVAYQRARSVEISSSKIGLLEADGELIGELPARIEIIPNAISFLM
jgi:diacylglycerol kinase (ATP)